VFLDGIDVIGVEIVVVGLGEYVLPALSKYGFFLLGSVQLSVFVFEVWG
jgi:hypothetical protein